MIMDPKVTSVAHRRGQAVLPFNMWIKCTVRHNIVLEVMDCGDCG